MPLANLATASDMVDYGYDAVADEVLARASQRVRTYTHQDITAGTSTLVISGVGPFLLPQRPVNSVTSVTASGVPVAYAVRGQLLFVGNGSRTRFSYGPSPEFTVAYTHGFSTVPDEVIELVCSIAARMGATPIQIAVGAQTEQAGGEMVGWGIQGMNGTTSLTAEEKKVLDRLFPRVRPRITLVPGGDPWL